MNPLSDQEIEALKSSLNNAIHELVFTTRYMEEDDLGNAAQCLMTAQGTLEQVAERLVKAGA